MRLTRIRKIDPVPYRNDYDYGKYGGAGGYGGYGGYDKEYYDNLFRNYSGNGTGGYDWLRNFSNFSGFNGWNNSDYMRNFYEHMARNFSDQGSGGTGGSGNS